MSKHRNLRPHRKHANEMLFRVATKDWLKDVALDEVAGVLERANYKVIPEPGMPVTQERVTAVVAAAEWIARGRPSW